VLTKPTRFPKRGAAEVSDIAVIKNIHLEVRQTILHEFSLNHLPVVLEIGPPVVGSLPLFLRKFTDWTLHKESFKRKLKDNPLKIYFFLASQ
jgi:hypothetical protein